MRWSEMLSRREALQQEARRLAEAPSEVIFDGWRAPDPMKGRLLIALRRADLRPSPQSFGALFGPAPAPPLLERHQQLARWVWWERLERWAEPVEPRDDGDRLAWAIAALRWHAVERDRLERAAWRHHHAPHPNDAQVRVLWEDWLRGRLQRLWQPWTATFARDAAAERAAVMRERGLPEVEIRRARAELLEGFLAQCATPPEDGPPPWREIAARVLETAGDQGPVEADGGMLGASERDRVARCAPHHRTWSPSWRAVTPHAPVDGDEQEFLSQWREVDSLVGAGLDALLDAHIVQRLLGAWAEPARTSLDPSWRVISRQLSQARARLRALVSALPEADLEAPLLGLDGLYSRTRYAVKRHFREWALKDLRHGLGGHPYAVNRPCVLPEPLRRRRGRGAARRAEERCWVLLVLLRGQGEALRRWMEDGGATAGTFARLLTGLPDSLVDQRAGERRTYSDLRASLRRHLDEDQAGLEPAFRAVAALGQTPARKLRGALEAALAPFWQPAIPFPEHGYPSMIKAAAALVASESA